MKGRIIHRYKLWIAKIDKERSIFNKDANSYEKIVYEEEPIPIIIQPNLTTFQTNSLFLSQIFDRSTGYLWANIKEVQEFYRNEENVLQKRFKIDKGDWIKSLQDANGEIFPLEFFIESIKPSANYGTTDLVRIYYQDRSFEKARNKDGQIITDDLKKQKEVEEVKIGRNKRF